LLKATGCQVIEMYLNLSSCHNFSLFLSFVSYLHFIVSSLCFSFFYSVSTYYFSLLWLVLFFFLCLLLSELSL
jgi:hypothetical protein